MPRKPRLYSYTVRYDDGSAPNPFGGRCTLAICKPAIRRTAEPGDWIAGLTPTSDRDGRPFAGRLIYAMKVEKKITLAEYDRRASAEWPERIPIHDSRDMSARLGDCIYDYSKMQTDNGEFLPSQRRGVHNLGNRPRDLRGGFALVSHHFYYFGGNAISLPDSLHDLIHQTQGHKSIANAPLLQPFEDWIASLKLPIGQLHGWPGALINWVNGSENYAGSYSSRSSCDDGDDDEDVVDLSESCFFARNC